MLWVAATICLLWFNKYGIIKVKKHLSSVSRRHCPAILSTVATSRLFGHDPCHHELSNELANSISTCIVSLSTMSIYTVLYFSITHERTFHS